MKKLIKSSLLSLPTPFSISFLWNMGFLLGFVLVLQIITGLMLSMNYVSSSQMAFESVVHTMRDVDSGWIMRFLHMNGASLFFIFMYIHLGRGIYFNSPKKFFLVWASGVAILFLSMMTAFMGYVLPWGQMSYWGATVITSMVSSFPYVGQTLIMWLWGDFSVSQPTLNRMFSLHFLAPFILCVVVILHITFLHSSGSSNPVGLNSNFDKMKFFPYFMIKDFTPVFLISFLLCILISVSPDILGDPENFNYASNTTTPTHIKPEWYFLFAYAILRCIPSKLGGVLAMILSISIMLVICLKNFNLSLKFNPLGKIVFWCFVSIFFMLTWLGGKPVNDTMVILSQLFTFSYFLFAFLI